MWITLIRLSYAPLRYLYINPDITRVRSYVLGCYLRYDRFPRKTQLGSLANRGTYFYLRSRALPTDDTQEVRFDRVATRLQ